MLGFTKKRAVAVAVAAGAMDAPEVEEQPSIEEVEIARLKRVIASQDETLSLSDIPQKVGLVEPDTFNPQVHYDILTELFGVFKGKVKKYHYECCDCNHEWIMSERQDGDDPCQCPACDTMDHDGDEQYEYAEEEFVASRPPTDDEVQMVHPEGRDTFFDVDEARTELLEHFAQLNGVEGDDMPVEWGSKNRLKPLPKPQVQGNALSDGIIFDDEMVSTDDIW